MKNNLLKKMFFAVVMLSSSIIFAQTVSGTVSDNSGPLPGANVVVKGTTNGATADFDGNFSINVPSDGVLIVSFVGYTSKEVSVNGQSTINVTLESNNQLDEVVVVAYGTQSRAEVTGAISTVSSEELTAVPVATADQALQGRAAGVTVVNSGSPGVAPTVKVRGVSSFSGGGPLYVIDGLISGGLGNLNPNDIESINVLKDAATAASYGSRGSNGVIIVTTKKGRSGKTQFNFNAYTGVQNSNRRYDLLNTHEYLEYAQEGYGVTPVTPASSSGVYTDWQDEIFRSGMMQNYDMSLAGGSETNDFRISAAYLEQEGTIIATDYKRYNFRANSNFKVGDNFKVGETLSVSFSNQSPEINGGGRSLLEHAIKSAPYLSVYNESNIGGYQGPSSPNDGQDAENAVRLQKLGSRENKVAQIFGNIYGEYKIIEGLKYKSQVGLEYSDIKFNSFTPSFNDDSEGTNTHFSNNGAVIVKNRSTYKKFLFTNSLSYDTTINDVHNLDFLLVAETDKSEFEQLQAQSTNDISDEVEQVTNNNSNLSSNSNTQFRIGYLGRINYNYDNKYLFAASLRRDGSSKFGDSTKWGWFPSISAGWNMANENFMSDSSFSTLKLRASWGTTGFDSVRDYAYAATLTSNYSYPFGGVSATGTSSAAGIANVNVAWEEKEKINIGLDFATASNKFTGAIEYYNDKSNGLLIEDPVPTSLGGGTFLSNAGDIQTSGVEVSLGYNNQSEGDFNWSADLNFSTVKNEVLKLGETGRDIDGLTFEGQQISLIREGEAIYSFYGLETDGIYQSPAEVEAVLGAGSDREPGDIRYIDQNNDGTINADDRVIIGNPFPDVVFGFNIGADYKNWDFNVFLNGVLGNEVYNTNLFDLNGGDTRLFNAGSIVLDRWTPTNPSTTIHRANGYIQNMAISDRFVENGSFARLKNLTIGYSFKEGTITENLTKLRVYISGQNLFTITDYTGLDPEVGNSSVISDSSFGFGIDRGNYPQPQSFLVGIQVGF